MKFSFLKRRNRVAGSLLASGAFIVLAVWGWGLPIETVASFFAILLLFLAVLVLAAALIGFILHRWRLAKDRADD